MKVAANSAYSEQLDDYNGDAEKDAFAVVKDDFQALADQVEATRGE